MGAELDTVSVHEEQWCTSCFYAGSSPETQPGVSRCLRWSYQIATSHASKPDFERCKMASHRLVLPKCRLECFFENNFDLIEASQEDYQIRLSMQDMPLQQKPVKASIVVVVRVVSVDQAVSAGELSV